MFESLKVCNEIMNMIGQVVFVQLKQCECVMNECMIQITHSFISAAGLEV